MLRTRMVSIVTIVALLVVFTALPASAAWTNEETGGFECGSGSATTQITANGWHRHRVGSLTPVTDTGSTNLRITRVTGWSVPSPAAWWLDQDIFTYWDYPQSWGLCN